MEDTVHQPLLTQPILLLILQPLVEDTLAQHMELHLVVDILVQELTAVLILQPTLAMVEEVLEDTMVEEEDTTVELVDTREEEEAGEDSTIITTRD